MQLINTNYAKCPMLTFIQEVQRKGSVKLERKCNLHRREEAGMDDSSYKENFSEVYEPKR